MSFDVHQRISSRIDSSASNVVLVTNSAKKDKLNWTKILSVAWRQFYGPFRGYRSFANEKNTQKPVNMNMCLTYKRIDSSVYARWSSRWCCCCWVFIFHRGWFRVCQTYLSLSLVFCCFCWVEHRLVGFWSSPCGCQHRKSSAQTCTGGATSASQWVSGFKRTRGEKMLEFEIILYLGT